MNINKYYIAKIEDANGVITNKMIFAASKSAAENLAWDLCGKWDRVISVEVTA